MKAFTRKKRLVLFLSLGAVFIVGYLLFQTFTHNIKHQPMFAVPTTALYRDPTQPIEVRVEDLLSYLTLSEKIGQMALVEKDSLTAEDDISRYYIGGLLSGAGSKPATNTATGWKDMIMLYQKAATQSRVGIPLLYGTDAIHGHAHVPGFTVFPHVIGLGATKNPELVRQVARATARDMIVTGVNWNFAPNLDQPRDIRWGRTYETFSDDPMLVSKLGAAYLEGLQAPIDASSKSLAVLATPKHYLGLGSMEWGTSHNKDFFIDQGVTPADEQRLRNHYLPPFATAVQSGALSIMVGLNTWGDKNMVFQKHLLTDVLKDEVGFKGFVVSDWYGVYEGQRSSFLATVRAVNAGVDMVMLPFDYKTFIQDVTWANRFGLISRERIDDAVRRILRAKFALGLFDESTKQPLFNDEQTQRKLAREAVAQSLVLLKNKEAILPLSKEIKHLRIAGGAANNLGNQLGAWTIEWQGVEGNWPAGATTIMAGIEAAVSEDTVVEYDMLGQFSGTKKAPIGIAVVGEKPYAEGWGDRALPILDESDRQAIKNLQASCESVVVVIVAGRPLLIQQEVASFDALVMAWLPGSEGAGVADVLFGDKLFVGTLPLPWPSHVEQLPISVDGITKDGTATLYPRYFGITK